MAQKNAGLKSSGTRHEARREIAGQTFDAAAIGMMAAGVGLAIAERDAVAAGRDGAQRSASAQAADIADTPVTKLLHAGDIWQADTAHVQGTERADAPQPVTPSNEDRTTAADRVSGNTAGTGNHDLDGARTSEDVGDWPDNASGSTEAAPSLGGGDAAGSASGANGSLFQSALHEMSAHAADISSSITSSLATATSYLNSTVDSIVDQLLGGRDTGLGAMLTSTVDQITVGPAHLLDNIGDAVGLQHDMLSSTSPLSSLPSSLLGATDGLAPDPILKTAFGAPGEFASGVVNTVSLADFDSGPAVTLGFLGQTYTDHPELGGHGVGTMLHGLV